MLDVCHLSVWQFLVLLCICYVTLFGVGFVRVFDVVAVECGCEGGFFMAGGVLEELQRLGWGIWCVRFLCGYCSIILRRCKNVL